MIIIIITCACIKIQAQDYEIITIAGCDDSLSFFGGDGGPAVNARLNYPENVHLDKMGNLYIADYGNARIRKITLSTGIITTVAGIDTFGYGGDGGPATDAILEGPEDVFTDSAGDIFFADGLENRVRKITLSSGTITTVAGNGTTGSYGDNGPATNAALNRPCGLCLDRNGNIYVSDTYNNKIRKVDALTNIITTIAGTGVAGNTGIGGLATNAELNQPGGIFLDSMGNIIFCDAINNMIKKIDATTGILTTIAGTGVAGYSGNGGIAANAELNFPGRGYIDNQNNLYFADYDNGAIRRIDGVTGIIKTVAGTGTIGFSGDGGPATDAQLSPAGVVLDSNGTIYIADFDNNRIRKVYSTLAVNNVHTNSQAYSLFPNPNDGNFTISQIAPDLNTVKAEITDVIGRMVYTGDLIFENGNKSLHLENHSPGLYLLTLIDSENREFRYKFVIE